MHTKSGMEQGKRPAAEEKKKSGYKEHHFTNDATFPRTLHYKGHYVSKDTTLSMTPRYKGHYIYIHRHIF